MADTMTISQGLRQASKLKNKLKESLERAQSSVSWKTDDSPAFTFAAMVEQSEQTRAELIRLQTRIAVANATTQVTCGNKVMLLAEAVRTLEELRGKLKWTRDLVVRAQQDTSETQRDYDGDKFITVKVSWKCALPEAQKAALVDSIQDEFDRLNDAVERVNGSTPLPE